MNLVDIRKMFREVSGRYDLVNVDFTDNGANFYLNEACKWLDMNAHDKDIFKGYSEGTETRGVYITRELSLDTDTNFWTSVYPLMMIKAAMMHTFKASGNKVMYDALERDLRTDLVSIDMVFVEAQARYADHMRG